MRKGDMPTLRREAMDDPDLAPRVLCRCGASLRTLATRNRRACSSCWDGQPTALPTAPRPRKTSTAKPAEPWTLARVAEILRVVEAADVYADLGSVAGIPYQQLTARSGAGLRSAYVVADKPLRDALTRLREVMMERARLRRDRWSKPQRLTIKRNEEA